MKHCLVILLLFMCVQRTNGQTVPELEKRLDKTDSMESKVKILEQILDVDSYNEHVVHFIRNYYNDQQYRGLFDKMIAKDTQNIKGYLLAAKYDPRSQGFVNETRTKYLDKALTLDSNNYEAVSLMAEAYAKNFYDLMDLDDSIAKRRKSYEKLMVGRKANAEKAKQYYIKAVELLPSSMLLFRRSILELSDFLNDTFYAAQARSYGYMTRVDKNLMPVDSPLWYFPTQAFARKSEGDTGKYAYLDIDVYKLDWYSNFLFSCGEPVMPFEPKTAEVYRFTWLRSFNPWMTIRLENKNAKRVLYWKYITSAEDDDEKSTLYRGMKEISQVEWNAFKRQLDSAAFWEMPTRNDHEGLDGAQWLLEAIKSGKYHVVDRWSPSDGTYKNACLFLLGLTGLNVSGNRVY